jgi:hypothetical protein
MIAVARDMQHLILTPSRDEWRAPSIMRQTSPWLVHLFVNERWQQSGKQERCPRVHGEDGSDVAERGGHHGNQCGALLSALCRSLMPAASYI